MNWREGFANSDDPLRKSDILRAILAVSRSPQEISDVVDRMEALPEGLQNYIAWDVVCNPSTTIDIYKRVKFNPYLLANTDVENVQSAWLRSHHGNLTQRVPDLSKASRFCHPVYRQLELGAPAVGGLRKPLGGCHAKRSRKRPS